VKSLELYAELSASRFNCRYSSLIL